MSRFDLLSLTPDDLAAITNRGTVKRAQRELEAGTPGFQIEESVEGDVVVTWSDGIVCRFPSGGTVHDAECSSGIVGISRHIIRSVLAYQVSQSSGDDAEAVSAKPNVSASRQTSSTSDVADAEAVVAGAEETLETSTPHVIGEAWDPGTFSDEDLVARFRQAAVTKARKRYEQGVVVELIRGEKPLARFLDDACAIRFLVPGDLRYVTADCADRLLSTYVPLAVWAFRELASDRPAGLVATQHCEMSVPQEPITDLRALLSELCLTGLTSSGSAWSQKLLRLERKLRDEGLIWPAELVTDLLHQHTMYVEHDACFDPLEVVHLVGELMARTRAIENGTRRVPQMLIRGSRQDRKTEVAGGRMVGLGVGVRVSRSVTRLDAYLQDADSGSVVSVQRTFADPKPDSNDEPRSFSDLAQTSLARGISLGSLGASQLLLKSAKRTPSGLMILPRTVASISANPQAFAWEQLKAPVAMEDFSQLAARLESLPPSYLRPRRQTENLHVCAVRSVEKVGFDGASQRLTAVLCDQRGTQALLVHPFLNRGRSGFEALAQALETRGAEVRYVCGHVSRSSQGVQVHPVCVIFDDGRRRTAIQPWIDSPTKQESAPVTGGGAAEAATGDHRPLQVFLEQLRYELSELLLSGVTHISDRTLHSWTDLVSQGRHLGFVRLTVPLTRLSDSLSQRAERVRWDATASAHETLELCLLSRVAADIVM